MIARLFTKLPIIISPGNIHDFSRNADAIFFYSMLNSRNPYYISQVQALSSLTIRASNVEPIGVGYVVFEPGMTAGFVGDANLIRSDKPELALGYALAAQYMGFKIVYFKVQIYEILIIYGILFCFFTHKLILKLFFFPFLEILLQICFFTLK